jgi:hypothetical protein
MPPGITANRYIKGAVCYADMPTAVVWGTHTPPAGWQLLYQGYCMGPNSGYRGAGPICVDNVDFDDSYTSASDAHALLYHVLPDNVATGDAGIQDKQVKCIVCKKE